MSLYLSEIFVKKNSYTKILTQLDIAVFRYKIAKKHFRSLNITVFVTKLLKTSMQPKYCHVGSFKA